ncbi:MAG TPA: MFS transporter [Chloroflexota bacterium]|nr:MFS transporter [Chloroflexota bacterium]
MIDAVRGQWGHWTTSATLDDRNIRNLVLQTVFAGVINGGIVTFLPVFLVRLGASAFLVSLLTSALAFTTIILSLPSGPIVARQRQLVAWSARHFLAIRVAYVAIAIAGFLDPAIAAPIIVVIWGLTGIPSTLANTAWYTVLAEAVPARRRPAVNGFRWALVGLVSAASVAFFGVMLDRLPFPAGYQIVFLFSFLAGVLNVWFYAKLRIPDQVLSVSVSSETWRLQLRSVVQPLREGGAFFHYVIASSVLRVGLYLPIGLFSVYWVIGLGASDTFIGLRTLVGNLALTVGYYTWGRIAGQLGHRRTLAIAAGGLGFYPILTGSAPSVEWLIPAALIWGLFASGIDVSLFEGILEVAPANRRHQFVAVNTFLANLIALSIPLAGASAAAIVGIPAVLFASGLLHFASVAMVGFLAVRARRPPAGASMPTPGVAIE